MAEDFNAQTIAEFRRNHGRVGGYFEGAPLVLLHTKGARTGRSHLVPVMYLKDGPRLAVFASKGGAPTNPDWYYNLIAHPELEIELGDETVSVRAAEALGAERDRLYKKQASLYPMFAEYQRKAKRTIPVMILSNRE